MSEEYRNPNMTRDGIEVKPGQVWRNCDYRMHGQLKTVWSVADGKARLHNPKYPKMPMSTVSIRRMYKHSTGWELVPLAVPAAQD